MLDKLIGPITGILGKFVEDKDQRNALAQEPIRFWMATGCWVVLLFGVTLQHDLISSTEHLVSCTRS